MKRLIIGSVASFVILSGFVSCGKPPVACSGDSLTDKAQVCPDRASLGFGQEFGTGTYIGQKPQDTIDIRNGGIANLNVASATISGDAEFTLSVAYNKADGTIGTELPGAVPGNKNLFLRVIFAPTLAKAYSATVTVTSDAENTPTATFPITGCGVPTDGGTSPCYRDGGQ